MCAAAKGWTVIDAEAGVMSSTYSFPGGLSNCFTARLPSGGVMIVSPPTKISGAQLDELGRVGRVEVIVANNGLHHLGLPTWRARFPNARCFAAPAAMKRINKKNKEAGDMLPLSMLQPELGEDVAVVEVPGSKGETWAWAKIEGGYAWYASDLLANMPSLPKSFFPRMLFKMTKSAPGYRTFNLAISLMLKDKKRGLQAMLDDVEAHPPTVMVPAHGDILRGESLAADTKALLRAKLG